MHPMKRTDAVNAATRLLEREQPPGYLEERTAYFGQRKADDESASRTAMAIFRIGAERLALPSRALTEVASMRPIHTLPHRRGGIVLGMANIRGTLIVCVSLSKLLALDMHSPRSPVADGHEQQRLLVIEGERGRLAFPVDQMYGIEHYRETDMRGVPETLAKATGRYTAAVLHWRERTVAYLDVTRTLHALERGLA